MLLPAEVASGIRGEIIVSRAITLESYPAQAGFKISGVECAMVVLTCYIDACTLIGRWM
jgi:hypothetical protein